MSVQPQSHDSEERLECGHCNDLFDRPAVEGSFCSPECHHAHQASKETNDVFNQLEYSHVWCHTCFKRLKTLEKPPKRNAVGKEFPDCVVGFQYRTEHAELGERSPYTPEDIPEDVPSEGDAPVYAYDHDGDEKNTNTYRDFRNPLPAIPSANDPVRTGTVCSCGNTSNRHGDHVIRNRSPFETAYYLALATRELRTEGKHDVRIDRDRLFDAVLEQTLPVEAENEVDIRDAFAKAVIL